jgi:alpha-beta hydrolase superfamily lysophospholipase
MVLLAGSGALDRDETVRANKPFKDLAWGLATRGIAVLRFDKVTYAHAAELKAARDFTLTDEYVPQALAAIRVLQDHAERVFVLGHSLGGAAAPRVAAAAPAVAGLVLLAGSAQPLHWAIVRQARHLASLAPGNDSRPVLATLTEQAERVDRGDLTGELPLGAPAAYWRDLRDHRPAELAATLGKPMLILQGGRDYQVTVADDLARWRAAVPHAAFRVYPTLNHLFAPGEGPSSPAEYERPGHVDAAVVADIADWLA